MLQRCAIACVVTVVLAGCAADEPMATEARVEQISVPVFSHTGHAGFNVATHLTGAEEVLAVGPGDPHPRDSRAQGQAVFKVSRDGSSVTFILIAANIHNVTMAHIHCGPRGENGPIRMWLHPVIGTSGAALAGGGGRHNGVLASGTFSPVGVMCPASAVGEDMSLLDAIRAGLTYVNVHTNDGTAVDNTGPGNFPGGELRGQIEHRGGH